MLTQEQVENWQATLGQDVLDKRITVNARLIELGIASKTTRYRALQLLLSVPSFVEFYDRAEQNDIGNRITASTRDYSAALEKRKATNIKRYGHETPFQAESVKAKIKSTVQEKYGCDNIAQNPEVKKRIVETNLERYDGIAPACSEAVRSKQLATNLARYNVSSTSQDPTVRAKQLATSLERYGVQYTCCAEQTKEKMHNTFLERYGRSTYKSLTPDEILHRLSLQHLEPTSPILGDSSLNKEIEVRCLDCGKVFMTHLLTGSDGRGYNKYLGCECKSHGTNLQTFVRDYIRSLGYTCEQRRFEWMGLKEIDCFIPELNLGFEINGYFTHNSEWNIFGSAPKSSSYHKAKSEACLAHGIKLYHIWHLSDSPEEQAVAKHIVDKALGVYTQRVFARKCKLEETTFADIRDFLDTYHMHGAIPANKYFKLTLDGKTLQVMTFKRVAGTTDTWELSRLATKHGVQIVGGSAKLFKHALPTLEGCKQLVSYAYRDFTPDPEDSVYTRLGFKFDSFTQPGLSFYAPHPVEFPSGVVIDAGVYSRQKFQAHKLAATYGCKTQDLPYLGLYKTFDSGNLKFIYTL